jgi:hypothetical protein
VVPMLALALMRWGERRVVRAEVAAGRREELELRELALGRPARCRTCWERWVWAWPAKRRASEQPAWERAAGREKCWDRGREDWSYSASSARHPG